MKNNLGFSLIEVLVATAMVGGLSLFTNKVYENSIRLTTFNRARFEESKILGRIHSEFAKSQTCLNNFATANNFAPTDPVVPMTQSDLTVLVDSTGADLIRKNTVIGNNDLLNIDRIDMEKAGDSRINLVISFSKNSNGVGPKNYTRRVSFFVESNDGNNISGCFDIEQSAEDSINELACAANEARGTYWANRDPVTNEITSCEKIGFDLEPCAGNEYVQTLVPASGSSGGSGVSRSCITVAQTIIGNCSSTANTFLSFDSSGNPVCQSLISNQLIFPFSQSIDQDFTTAASRGFIIEDSLIKLRGF